MWEDLTLEFAARRTNERRAYLVSDHHLNECRERLANRINEAINDGHRKLELDCERSHIDPRIMKTRWGNDFFSDEMLNELREKGLMVHQEWETGNSYDYVLPSTTKFKLVVSWGYQE